MVILRLCVYVFHLAHIPFHLRSTVSSALGIQEKVFALTFINVTIYLSIFGARALVFDKNDERRLDFYSGKTAMATILAATANMVVMCFEPLVCKNWFASVGGHIWFDVTLWMMMMSVMQ